MNYFEKLFSLAGKTALVTGGSSGIGRMIVEGLVMAGAHVLIVSRKREACEQTADEINAIGAPGHARSFPADISTQDGVASLVAATKSEFEALDILVNNAGRTWGASFDSFPYDAWDRVLSVNLTAMFTLIQGLLPLLKAGARAEDPSRVINLGSIVGSQPLGNNAYSYAASKAGVHHITRILANELAASHVTVNALAPGPFESRMMAFATSDAARRARLIASVPLGRLGIPSDIAAALLYLCGAGGSYVSGAVLPIDGGKHVSIPTGASDDE
ncbi:SDR family oxidoreductase [Caballeronia sp. SEWSISQ10-4 2]|uniref:SDR family oxidoreductase n=1 Tax=Caballeronia sp. SEWSISQ10-4 2 TaxID=2937438 RepID=UPI0026506EBD|nr:SDR family oxidoreductase [Caballeronia sp. SEWSISQ10-4 2]MDN7177101.1 SDR family oxidoreductase [Caballeronia sp. SEWSISQ10-4 2]